MLRFFTRETSKLFKSIAVKYLRARITGLRIHARAEGGIRWRHAVAWALMKLFYVFRTKLTIYHG